MIKLYEKFKVFLLAISDEFFDTLNDKAYDRDAQTCD